MVRSRATGAVSLALFTAVMVLGILTAGRAGTSALPRAGLLRLHRTLTLTSMAFLTVHIVTAIGDSYVDLTYLDVFLPFSAGFDPLWIGLAAVAVDLMLAIAITSALRRFMSPRLWRWIHLSAYAMWPLALLHGFGVSGGDGRETWMVVLDVVVHCRGAGRVGLPAEAGSTPRHRGQTRRGHRSPADCSRKAPMTSTEMRPDSGVDHWSAPPAHAIDRLLPNRPARTWRDHQQRWGPLEVNPSEMGHLAGALGASALVGRGGAGFPTGRKLASVAAAVDRFHRPAVVIANICEGDPTSAKDQVLAHHSPHLVIDGALAAAAAVGADRIVFAMHCPFPRALGDSQCHRGTTRRNLRS